MKNWVAGWRTGRSGWQGGELGGWDGRGPMEKWGSFVFGFLNRLGGIGSGQHVSGSNGKVYKMLWYCPGQHVNGSIDRWISCFGVALGSM